MPLQGVRPFVLSALLSSVHDKTNVFHKIDSHKLLGPLLASRVHLPDVSGKPKRGDDRHSSRTETTGEGGGERGRAGEVWVYLLAVHAVAE